MNKKLLRISVLLGLRSKAFRRTRTAKKCQIGLPVNAKASGLTEGITGWNMEAFGPQRRK